MASSHCTTVPLYILAFLTFLEITWAQQCFVVAPNMVRLGSTETVAIIVEGPQQRVQLSLLEYPNERTISTRTETVNSGNSKITHIKVRDTDLPESALLPGAKAYVVLKVTCTSSQGSTSSQARLLVSRSSAEYVFVQTDKPIYKPGSNVQIRLLSVDENLKPSTKQLTLQILNPQGIIVEQEAFRPANGPIFSHSMPLPETTIVGEWTIVVKYGYKGFMSVNTTFKVEKYVLPKFSVDIMGVPDYILKSFTLFNFTVRARFVNQQPVQGFVTYRIGAKSEIGNVHWIASNAMPKGLTDGDAKFTITLEELKSLYGSNNQQWDDLFSGRFKLVIEATVGEEATAARETSTYDNTHFTISPFVISLEKTQRSFKPGMVTYVLAEVTYPNGGPASGVKLKLTGNTTINGTFTTQTDHRGLASFPIITSIGEKAILVKVLTSATGYQGNQQANAMLSIQPYTERSNAFIGIERTDPKRLYKVNEQYKAGVYTDSPKEFQKIYFAVISKGRVQLLRKLQEGAIIERSFEFTVTEQMTPSFRIVAYARTSTGDSISDSIYVNTEPACTHSSEVTVYRGDEQRGHLEPGSTETIVVSGTPGTTVGLIGIDKAVYLLSRKDLLTREKMFQMLDTRDLGCGVGGGVNSRQALLDSGVVLISGNFQNSIRQDSSCHEGHHRRRREAIEGLSEKYEDGALRKCCEHGFRKDRFARTCQHRVDVLRKYIDEDDLNGTACVEAFEHCCYLREDEDDHAGARTTSSGFDELDELDIADFGASNILWRSDFRETWLFSTITIGATGRTEVPTTLPSSITTWELAAVSVSPEGGVCVAPPIEILTFKKVFLEVNLPYSVVVNEQIEIPITLYNYGSHDIRGKVYLHGTRDICSGAKVGEPSEPQELNVPAGRGRTAIFPVVPLDVGERLIQVSTITSEGTDAVQRKLRIEPRGVQKNDNLVVLLDPANQQRRTTRSAQNSSRGGIQYQDIMSINGDIQVVTIQKPRAINVIPGTESCELGIVGDRIGPALDTAINNPQGLVRLPKGCGEQTMTDLAPTLYVYGYLKTSLKITDAVENKALDYIRSGYNNMLTHRKPDGSFAIYSRSPSNLWLTAFVIRNFCEARKWTMIDENVITSGLRYLLKMQKSSGEFVANYDTSAKLLGGILGPVPVTAYVVITLAECANDGVQMGNEMTAARAKATAFLERNLGATTDPYTLALSAYALSLANSTMKHAVLERLKRIANYREGDNARHIIAANTPHSIEATSYAIMAFINEHEDLAYINGYINWMNQQLQPSGAFKSTQDTVVALQALTRYATFAKEKNMDLTCEVTLSNSRDFNKTVRIRRDNSHILQKVPIVSTSDVIFLNVKGIGTANAFFSYSYREEKTEDELCKFNITITFEENKLHDIMGRVVRGADPQGNTKRRRDVTYGMTVCARSLGNEDIGMSIIDVGLLTGFLPVRDDLERLKVTKVTDLYELTKRNVVFYQSKIPRKDPVCIHFNLTREYVVGKMQSSTVRVYDYYNPDVACSRFYGPDSSSPMLKYFCPQGSSVCQCAEGGCPSDDPMRQFMIQSGDKKFTKEEQRENMREFACDKADYVWKGTVTDIEEKDGFKRIKFLVNAVLKPGREGRDELTGRSRLLKMRDNCKAFDLEDSDEDTELIVMGVETDLKEEGAQEFQYIIDASAIVIPAMVPKYEQKYRGQNALMAWFNAEFSNPETPCYL